MNSPANNGDTNEQTQKDLIQTKVPETNERIDELEKQKDEK